METIPVDILSSIFSERTNSYKHYWFLGIIDHIQQGGSPEIHFDELCVRMFETVWYPLSFYKISFGRQDSFIKSVQMLHDKGIKDLDGGLIARLTATGDEAFSKELLDSIRRLARYVPYRLLRPFFRNELRGLPDARINAAISQLALQHYTSGSSLIPYHIEGKKIIINPHWYRFMQAHMGILRNFVLWELVQFLQHHNPNVIGIPKKLFKPEKRNLSLNTKGWSYYIDHKGGLRCIYSDTEVPQSFSLDHFLPWSYVVHDQNWNILPVSREINSSKSDSLPSTDLYLKDFTRLQHDFFQTIYNNHFDGRKEILEHYSLFFNDTAAHIYDYPLQQFEGRFHDSFKPMYQIAANMGFAKNWIYAAR